MEEIWKPYIEGFYEVSTLGNIRSLDRYVSHWRGGMLLRPGIPIKATVNSKGYPTVVICKDGGRSTTTVHRVVAQVFIPNPLNLPEVNHKDGVKLNNRVDNLEWCTSLQNQQHAYDIGITARGEASSVAILNEDTVRLIRKLVLDGLNYSQIGTKLSINKSTVRQVAIRNTWKHVL